MADEQGHRTGVSATTVSAVSQAAETVPGRRGAWFAALWLFFLAQPLQAAWGERDTWQGVAGAVVTIVFAVVYMAVWLRARRDNRTSMPEPGLGVAIPWLVLLAALATGMVLLLGEAGMAGAVYCAVACVMLFPSRVAALLVLGVAAVCLAAYAVHPGWSSPLGLSFSILAASLAVWGIRQMIMRNADLVRAQGRNAELAVENERTRFARDLHDILGHSLTVITVKAELARKLLDVDRDRAAAELADLERLSRDALADVRRAVEGYRELTLPGELARARTALAAAEIEADLPGSAEQVPSERRELFAWAVREGVTNVIRHSGARHCAVVLTPDRVEVRDDGVGPGRSGSGHGLVGLRERASALGGTVTTRALDPGFSLAVQA
jgi:two-component system sensor histidine kinase DesK